MKNENKNATTTMPIVSNPFEALATSASSEDTTTRKLDYTPVLVSRATQRATECIKTASATPELHELANRMMSGNTEDLLELFEKTGLMQFVNEDAAELAGASDDVLKRMLESRRSDRSKLKRKGISNDIATCRGYIAAMYAELMVREAMGKPYTGAAGAKEIDIEAIKDDMDAVNRKIKSLQSKKCRLKKTAEFVEVDAAELSRVEAEIERLNALRPTSKVSTEHVVKSIKVDELRAALSQLSPDDVPADVLELMKKLG